MHFHGLPLYSQNLTIWRELANCILTNLKKKHELITMIVVRLKNLYMGIFIWEGTRSSLIVGRDLA